MYVLIELHYDYSRNIFMVVVAIKVLNAILYLKIFFNTVPHNETLFLRQKEPGVKAVLNPFFTFRL